MNDILQIDDNTLKQMWDCFDGRQPSICGYAGKEIHAELNRRGLGRYCAV